MVKLEEAKQDWSFPRWKYIKPCTRGVIKGSVAWSKVRLICFEILKQQQMFYLRVWTLNHNEKGMNKAFSSYKLTSKLWMVYLEVTLQQSICFYMWKCMKKDLTNVFRRCKQTDKVSRTYLVFKILKMSRQWRTYG